MTEIDPVCGMEVDTEAAAAVSEYNGTTYYFCSVGCKEAFDADPKKYLGGAAPAAMPSAMPPAAKKWWQFWK